MKYKNILIIGGGADGQRHSSDVEHLLLQCANDWAGSGLRPNSRLPIAVNKYELVAFDFEGITLRVFKEESLSIEQTLQLLVEGYRKYR